MQDLSFYSGLEKFDNLFVLEYANCKLTTEGITAIVGFLSTCYKNSDEIKEGLCSIEVMEKIIDVMIMTLFDGGLILTPAFELAAVADIVESDNYQIFSFAAKTPDSTLFPESTAIQPLEESQLSDNQDPIGTWSALQLR